MLVYYYLVHSNNEWQLGLIHDAAGIQHIGHEGYWIYAARSVHYIYNNGWKS